MKLDELPEQLRRDVRLALRQYAEDDIPPPPIEELIKRFEERQDNS